MQSLKTCSWTSTFLKVFFSSLLWLMNLNKHLVYWESVIVYQWCVTWNSSDKWRNDRLRTFCRAILNIWHVFLEDNDAVFVSRENINSMVYWVRWRSFRALFYITSPEAKVNHIGQTSPFCLVRAIFPAEARYTPMRNNMGCWSPGLRVRVYIVDRPLPSSKNPHFQNEARCTTFLVKMRIKNDFHIKGLAPTLVLKQRPGELANGLFWYHTVRKHGFAQICSL